MALGGELNCIIFNTGLEIPTPETTSGWAAAPLPSVKAIGPGIQDTFSSSMKGKEDHPFMQCCVSALALMRIRIRIQLFSQMWIRIQGAKLIRIRADPDRGQSQKFRFLHEKYT